MWKIEERSTRRTKRTAPTRGRWTQHGEVERGCKSGIVNEGKGSHGISQTLSAARKAVAAGQVSKEDCRGGERLVQPSKLLWLIRKRKVKVRFIPGEKGKKGNAGGGGDRMKDSDVERAIWPNADGLKPLCESSRIKSPK